MRNKVACFTALATLFSAVLFSACSTGKQAYQKGDYYDACMIAIDRLKSDPKNAKARETLSKAYLGLIQTYLQDINNLTSGGSVSDYDKAIVKYSTLNTVSDAIYNTPAALEVVKEPSNFTKQRQELMDIAGVMHYDQGVRALNAGTMQQARIALDHFTYTDKYIPGYKDVTNLKAVARYNATMRVIVYRPTIGQRYQLDTEFFYTKFMSQISRKTYNNLVRFYTPEEAEALGMNDPHSILLLDFVDFTVGNTKETSKSVEVKKDNVLIGTTIVNGQKHDVHGTVKANYITNRLEIMSGGVLNIRVINPNTNKTVNQKNISHSSVWYTEWFTYTGDDRALSSSQIKNTKVKPSSLPSYQTLFASFVSPLFDKASSFVGYVY